MIENVHFTRKITFFNVNILVLKENISKFIYFISFMMHCFSTSDSYQYKKMGFHPLILNHVKKYSVKWCEI